MQFVYLHDEALEICITFAAAAVAVVVVCIEVPVSCGKQIKIIKAVKLLYVNFHLLR